MNNENQFLNPDVNKELNPTSGVSLEQNNQNTAMEEKPYQRVSLTEAIPTDKSSKKTLLVFIALFLVICLGIAAFFFFRIKNSKERIIINSLEHLQNVFKNKSNIELDLPNIREFLQTGTISLDLESSDEDIESILKMIKDFQINFNAEQRENFLYFELDLLYADESIIDFRMIAENNKIYLLIERLINQVLMFEANTDVLLQDDYLTIKDVQYLYNLILERIIRDMDSSFYTQERVDIILNGEEVSTTKTTITLDNERIVNLANKVLNNLRRDNRADEILTKLYKNIDEFKFEDNFERDITITYSIYTTGFFNNVVLGVDFVFEAEESRNFWGVEPATKLAFEYRAENNETIYIRDLEGLTSKLVFRTEDSNLMITIYDEEQVLVANVLVKNPDVNTLSVELEVVEESLKITWDLNIEAATPKEEYNISNVFRLSFVDGNNYFSGALMIDINTRDVSNLPRVNRFNTSGAKSFEDLTESDFFEIMDNLQYLFMMFFFNGFTSDYYEYELNYEL